MTSVSLQLPFGKAVRQESLQPGRFKRRLVGFDGSGISLMRYLYNGQIIQIYVSVQIMPSNIYPPPVIKRFTNLFDQRNAPVQILQSPLPKQPSLLYGLNQDYKTKSLAFLRLHHPVAASARIWVPLSCPVSALWTLF